MKEKVRRRKKEKVRGFWKDEGKGRKKKEKVGG